MTLSSNRGAYQDCFILFEKALASPRGVQKVCPSSGEAHMLRLRLNKARALDAQTWGGTSEFYSIMIRVEYEEARRVWLCKLEKKQFFDTEVEEIPGEALPLAKPPWEERKDDDTFELPESVLDESPPGVSRDRRF